MTPAELAELDADRTKARKVFVGWLVLATLLTLAGNAAAAMLGSLPPLGVRLAVHLLPPAVALVGFHALAAFARAGAIHRSRKGLRATVRDAGPVYVAATAGVLLIAALAVVLSYAGLIEVARAGGLGRPLDRIWPLTIDLGIAVSTVCLTVLRPISASDLRASRRAAKATAAPTAAPAASAPDAMIIRTASPGDLPTRESEPASPTRESQVREMVRHVSESPTDSITAAVEAPTDSDDAPFEWPEVTQDHLDRAAPLTQRSAVVTQPIAKPIPEIALVLALLEVVSERRAATLLKWSTNTVSKVRKADAAVTAAAAQPHLAAV